MRCVTPAGEFAIVNLAGASMETTGIAKKRDGLHVALQVGLFLVAYVFLAGFVCGPLFRWIARDFAGSATAVLVSAGFASWLCLRAFEEIPIWALGLRWSRAWNSPADIIHALHRGLRMWRRIRALRKAPAGIQNRYETVDAPRVPDTRDASGTVNVKRSDMPHPAPDGAGSSTFASAQPAQSAQEVPHQRREPPSRPNAAHGPLGVAVTR